MIRFDRLTLEIGNYGDPAAPRVVMGARTADERTPIVRSRQHGPAVGPMRPATETAARIGRHWANPPPDPGRLRSSSALGAGEETDDPGGVQRRPISLKRLANKQTNPTPFLQRNRYEPCGSLSSRPGGRCGGPQRADRRLF